MHWKKRQWFAQYQNESRRKKRRPGDLFLDVLLHAPAFSIIPAGVLEQKLQVKTVRACLLSVHTNPSKFSPSEFNSLHTQ